MIQDATGVAPVSLHHDISTVTGEVVIVVSLTTAPDVRESKKK